MVSGNQQVSFGVSGKVSFDAVFLRCAIAGFDLHTYFVLPATHGDDLGQTSLSTQSETSASGKPCCNFKWRLASFGLVAVCTAISTAAARNNPRITRALTGKREGPLLRLLVEECRSGTKLCDGSPARRWNYFDSGSYPAPVIRV